MTLGFPKHVAQFMIQNKSFYVLIQKPCDRQQLHYMFFFFFLVSRSVQHCKPMLLTLCGTTVAPVSAKCVGQN